MCYKTVPFGLHMAIVPMNALKMPLLTKDLHKTSPDINSPCMEEELMRNQHSVRNFTFSG